MSASLPVLVVGRSGRMAQALARQVSTSADLSLAGILPGRGSTVDTFAEALAASPEETVICDFSHRSTLRMLLASMERAPRRLVTGTSGLEASDEAALAATACHVAVLQARNFSLGAIMARELIRILGRLSACDTNWQAAVLDFHHGGKLDRKSATARDWASAWAEGTLAESAPGRSAPISAIRLGDAISEHSFIAAGRGERLEIAHRLLSFDAPVAGALAAARFLASRPPGLYGADCLLQP